jgi:hypothetical protein
VQLFHYHLVTSRVRELEARYLGKLGFELVARYGRVGNEPVSYEPGIGWEELDAIGFKLRLSELQRGCVNVVVQPGYWDLPRVDHVGVVLDEDGFRAALGRATLLGRRVQERAGRRTFVATRGGYRLELHPPRDWLDELLEARDELALGELRLRADLPVVKARALAELLGLDCEDGDVEVGETVVRFVDGGPEGRPQLDAEVFV